MSLIYDDEIHIHFLDIILEHTGGQTLWGDIEELEVAIGGIVQCELDLATAHSGIDAQGLDASVIEVLHLVLHQCDQRGHHYGNSLSHKRRDLKTHRFSASCRKYGQHVAAVKSRVDYVFLTGPERVVSPVFGEDFQRCHIFVYSHITFLISRPFHTKVRRFVESARKSKKIIVFEFAKSQKKFNFASLKLRL